MARILNHRHLVPLLLLGWLLLTGHDFPDYPPATMAEAVAAQPVPGETADAWYSAYPVRNRVLLAYTGNTRPLPDAKMTQIKGWLRSTGQGPELTELLSHEIQVAENGNLYWLTIPDPTLNDLHQHLNAGETAAFYIGWIGATRNEHVFLLESYRPPSTDTPPDKHISKMP